MRKICAPLNPNPDAFSDVSSLNRRLAGYYRRQDIGPSFFVSNTSFSTAERHRPRIKFPLGKDGQYRDTGSVELGSRQNIGSLSGSENRILGLFVEDTFGGSLDTEPESGSGSPIKILRIVPVLAFRELH